MPGHCQHIIAVRLVYIHVCKLDYITAVILWQVFCWEDGELMYILRASFTDKNGVKHYAKEYGKRAFKIWIGPGPEPMKK